MNRSLEIIYRIVLQPKALAGWAGMIVVTFAIVHALGWREFTTVLSGTVPMGASGLEAMLKAGAYMAAYFSAVLVAPILTLAAMISFVLERWVRTWRVAR